MKRPDVFTELEAAAVGCIALEGTCIRSAYVHDLYVLICDYKGVTVYVRRFAPCARASAPLHPYCRISG